MNRIWIVLKREYLENVRTKAFLIGLILTPVWMGLVFLIPALARSAGPTSRPLVVVDQTGLFATPAAEGTPEDAPPTGPLVEALSALEGYDLEVVDPAGAFTAGADGEPSLVEGLRQRAGQGELFAIVLTPPVLQKRPPSEGEYPTEVFGPQGLAAVGRHGQLLVATVNEVVTNHIISERSIDAEAADLIRRPAVLRYTGLDESGERATPASQVAPFIFMMLLFMGIVGISQMLISSTLEEKGNRVFEVLLSSISPFQLMVGKILGICAVGFTLLTLWSGGGLIALFAQGIGDVVSAAEIGYFLIYYLLGFLLIASLMVAVGSACNTLKEAQNLMAPISLFLALPIMLSMLVIENPNGPLATGASFFPPFTPFLMMVRISAVPGPPGWQIAVSIVLLIVSVFIAFRAAARVFRVGVLLHGQPPRLREIWRWMRTRD